MDLSSFLTFLGERTFFVSITILVLLAIRPLAKKLPRKGMYFLWVILVLRILCPVNFTGIYHLLPAANATNAQIKQELSFGGAMNQYRLSPVQQKRFQSKQQKKSGTFLFRINFPPFNLFCGLAGFLSVSFIFFILIIGIKKC